mmetsp:Transcript_40046/g.118760  ORF Transcript_40046/g.118760 Transcript_40046/m.118760 type:complete len:80 (+) Transcript_40046:312-551(+)
MAPRKGLRGWGHAVTNSAEWSPAGLSGSGRPPFRGGVWHPLALPKGTFFSRGAFPMACRPQGLPEQRYGGRDGPDKLEP